MAITVGKTGNIGQGTDALAQLRGFTDGLQGSDRLRGHKGADGNITLHVRTGAPSFWTKVSPKAIYHRHLAQKAIARVLTNAERGTGGANLSAAKNANAGGARSGLDRLFKSGEITGAASKVVSEGAAAIQSGAQKAHAVTKVDGRISDDTNTISIGNDTYSKIPNKEIKGSEGVVTFYSDGNGGEIAVKFMMASAFDSPEKQSAAMGREIEAHRQVGSGGHPNVLEFKGAIRGSDGQLGIAMEVAGSGTMQKASHAINAALKDGVISAGAAQTMRLTLIKDMMAGMSHVNATSGMAHLDLKYDNVFLDAAGVAKIADFGKTGSMADWERAVQTMTNAYDFTPPEMQKANSAFIDINKAYTEGGAKRSAVINDILNNFPNLNSEDELTLLQNISDERISNDTSAVVSNRDLSKWDAWAAGSTAFTVLYERPLVSGAFAFRGQAETYLQAYAGSGAAGPLQATLDDGKLVGGTLGGSSGNDAIDDLLTRLLAPTADARAQIDDVKDHALFQDAKVGSGNARTLLLELLKPTRNDFQIARLSAQL